MIIGSIAIVALIIWMIGIIVSVRRSVAENRKEGRDPDWFESWMMGYVWPGIVCIALIHRALCAMQWIVDPEAKRIVERDSEIRDLVRMIDELDAFQSLCSGDEFGALGCHDLRAIYSDRIAELREMQPKGHSTKSVGSYADDTRKMIDKMEKLADDLRVKNSEVKMMSHQLKHAQGRVGVDSEGDLYRVIDGIAYRIDTDGNHYRT